MTWIFPDNIVLKHNWRLYLDNGSGKIEVFDERGNLVLEGKAEKEECVKCHVNYICKNLKELREACKYGEE